MIKAIITDFGSVLYKTKWKKIDKEIFKKHKIHILIEDKRYGELIKIYRESDLGKENFGKFFLKLKPSLKNIKELIESYKKLYSKHKILNEKLLEFLFSLKEKKIRLFGFSDIKKEHFEANKKFGIYKGFEKIFSSFEFGVFKSNKKAFEILKEKLKEYKLKPEECLFIDDNLENIKRAKEFRFKTILYNEFPKIRRIKKKILEEINKT